MPGPFDTLPPEITLNIFSFMSSKRELTKSVTPVCKQWKEFAAHKGLPQNRLHFKIYRPTASSPYFESTDLEVTLNEIGKLKKPLLKTTNIRLDQLKSLPRLYVYLEGQEKMTLVSYNYDENGNVTQLQGMLNGLNPSSYEMYHVLQKHLNALDSNFNLNFNPTISCFDSPEKDFLTEGKRYLKEAEQRFKAFQQRMGHEINRLKQGAKSCTSIGMGKKARELEAALTRTLEKAPTEYKNAPQFLTQEDYLNYYYWDESTNELHKSINQILHTHRIPFAKFFKQSTTSYDRIKYKEEDITTRIEHRVISDLNRKLGLTSIGIGKKIRDLENALDSAKEHFGDNISREQENAFLDYKADDNARSLREILDTERIKGSRFFKKIFSSSVHTKSYILAVDETAPPSTPQL